MSNQYYVHKVYWMGRKYSHVHSQYTIDGRWWFHILWCSSSKNDIHQLFERSLNLHHLLDEPALKEVTKGEGSEIGGKENLN